MALTGVLFDALGQIEPRLPRPPAPEDVFERLFGASLAGRVADRDDSAGIAAWHGLGDRLERLAGLVGISGPATACTGGGFRPAACTVGRRCLN